MCTIFDGKMNARYINTRYINKFTEFVWQHFWLLISLYIMTLGVALCIRSNLGSSVISSLPMSFSLAGIEHKTWELTIGGYTNIMNFILVGAQILVLRKKFEFIQLLQLVIGFFFGALIDINMGLTESIVCDSFIYGAAVQFVGCSVMGFGIAMEVRCGSVTMPGEGLPVALSRVTNIPFPKWKITVDILLVILAVLSCYYFWGAWQWNIIGVGTLFAMFYVGLVVKFFHKRMKWFDMILDYHPGFRRTVYGLARFVYTRFSNNPK